MIYHDRRYLETLRELSASSLASGYVAFGLGPADNPIFEGMYELSALIAGGSLAAARLVSREGFPAAFNISGGMHHAITARAAGFCYVNDPVLAIRRLAREGKRVAYVDIDAHHGDGVQWAFFETDQVLTISLHQHPATLFPGTGYQEEMGRGAGKGFSVNLPLWIDTDDDVFIESFEEVVPPPAHRLRPGLRGDPAGGGHLHDRPPGQPEPYHQGLRLRGAPLQGPGLGPLDRAGRGDTTWSTWPGPGPWPGPSSAAKRAWCPTSCPENSWSATGCTPTIAACSTATCSSGGATGTGPSATPPRRWSSSKRTTSPS